jgi:hypothetical protein
VNKANDYPTDTQAHAIQIVRRKPKIISGANISSPQHEGLSFDTSLEVIGIGVDERLQVAVSNHVHVEWLSSKTSPQIANQLSGTTGT